MILTYSDSDRMVEKLNDQSDDTFYWDGWDICKFVSAPAAIYDKDGRYDHSKKAWGYITKYSPNSEGIWEIDLDN